MSEPVVAQKFPFVQNVTPGIYHWCSCGQSKNQPFCDGAHRGTEFAPFRVEFAEPQKVAWCGCKHSKNGALCDGSHKNLP